MLNLGNKLDVLTALRTATAERHSALDTRTPLAAESPDLRAYRDHLHLLEAWLAPLQPALADGQPGLPPRDHLALIRADLAHPALDGLPALPVLAPAPLPHLDDAAYRWGVAYVVEGSQLGGAVLYKRLAQRLAPHPLAYLRGDGSPGPRWQQFLAALRAAVVTERQIEQACRGARQAFDSLIWLVERLNSSSAPPAGRP
ncbi:heme oxygenase [Duganella sp. FT50W]|uniref:Heme oxygenase n=1 Tax=Duganella lactea TaxID=2692173 RepID=A0A6L8MFU3_9BURK|nr:heme oxygenase [Duganella lactea]MYM81269.1 heme oxygenase [Duganella lactea]